MKKVFIITSVLVGLFTIGLASCSQVQSPTAAAENTDGANPLPAVTVVKGSDLVTEDYLTGLKVIDYIGSDTNIEIPATKDGKDILLIDANAFKNKNLIGVITPATVTEIGASAFANNAITTLSLDNAVTTIGANAFENNAITSFAFPTQLTSVGANAFAGNSFIISVTGLTPSTTINLGTDSFSSASLYVPNGAVASYKASANWNNAFKLVTTIITSTDVTTNDVSGGLEIAGYTGSDTSIVIPKSISGKAVVSIGDQAFYNKGFTDVLISDGVKTLGEWSFAGSSNVFTTITIPDSVTTIGDSAFAENTTLTTVSLGSGLTVIESGNFSTSPITAVSSKATTPPSLDSAAFSSGKIDDLYVPASAVGAYQGNANWSAKFTTISAITP